MSAHTPAGADLLDRFFAAIEAGDIDAVAGLYTEDVEVWHNVTGVAVDRAASLKLLRYWTRSVRDLRYEVLERHPFEGGAVQRHVVHGDAGGTTLSASVCIVFHFEADRISRIYEYLDPAAVSAVFGTPEAHP